jgi:hypothetical protein
MESTQHQKPSSLESEPFDNDPIGSCGEQGPRLPKHHDHRRAGSQPTGIKMCSDADLVS